MRTSRPWARVLAVVVPLLVAGAAHAQLQVGNLNGRVVDEQGDALPGVTVTLSGVGAPQVQVTSAKGRFRFLNLGPGSYALKAELEGFATVDLPNVGINIGRNTAIKVTMHMAQEELRDQMGMNMHVVPVRTAAAR
jgi:Carboxypeptidase regulatory-like domain